jgi:hypothetical protein
VLVCNDRPGLKDLLAQLAPAPRPEGHMRLRRLYGRARRRR